MAAPWAHMILKCQMKSLNCHTRNVYLEFIRRCSLATNHKITLDPKVKQALDDGMIQTKTHPGLRRFRIAALPPKLNTSIELLIHKYPSKDIKLKAEEFRQYLLSRRKPVEDEELTYRARMAEAEGLEAENFNEVEDEMDRQEVINRVQRRVKKHLRGTTYHWQPIEYNAYKSFTYMVARTVFDYSSMMRIFAEMKHLDKSFSPVTMYDSGSGVGSAVWAANETWKKSLKEHFCVDPSADMNTIARLLMQDGREDKPIIFPNVYFRQFHPPSAERKYDLVVSAYTLIELPNQAERIKYLLRLWRKTEKYLVIAELGTNAGFNLVAEAREFILQLSDEEVQSRLYGPAREENLKGHVIAPCPHDQVCPKLSTPGRHGATPCNFPVKFVPLKVQKIAVKKDEGQFSYVVLQKGERDESVVPWPRIVRDNTIASGRVHCRLCLPSGHLQHSVISKARHGKELLHCARAAKCGDVLPVVPTAGVWIQEDSTRSEGQDNGTSEGLGQDKILSEGQESVQSHGQDSSNLDGNDGGHLDAQGRDHLDMQDSVEGAGAREGDCVAVPRDVL